MKKEEFLFELINEYLYIASIGCMVLENYCLDDRTNDYTECANRLERCLDFYDQLYNGVDTNEYTEEEINAQLIYLVQSLKQKTIQNIQEEFEKCIQNRIENPNEFIREHLYLDENKNKQKLTKKAFENFIRNVRKEEEAFNNIKNIS